MQNDRYIDVKYIVQFIALKYSRFSLFRKRCWRRLAVV